MFHFVFLLLLYILYLNISSTSSMNDASCIIVGFAWSEWVLFEQHGCVEQYITGSCFRRRSFQSFSTLRSLLSIFFCTENNKNACFTTAFCQSTCGAAEWLQAKPYCIHTIVTTAVQCHRRSSLCCPCISSLNCMPLSAYSISETRSLEHVHFSPSDSVSGSECIMKSVVWFRDKPEPRPAF